MKVREVMKKRVVCVKPEDNLRKAMKLMTKNGVSGLAVVEDKRIIGVLSISDILNATRLKFSKSSDPLFALLVATIKKKDIEKKMQYLESLKVADVMIKKPITVKEDERVERAVEKMCEGDVNRIFVINKHGELVGVIARIDIIKALA